MSFDHQIRIEEEFGIRNYCLNFLRDSINCGDQSSIKSYFEGFAPIAVLQSCYLENPPYNLCSDSDVATIDWCKSNRNKIDYDLYTKCCRILGQNPLF